MEKGLNVVFEEVLKQENVVGCAIADKHGLCLLASAPLQHEVCGVVSNMAQLAGSLHPEEPDPVISLQGDHRECLIYRAQDLTTAIFKTKQVMDD